MEKLTYVSCIEPEGESDAPALDGWLAQRRRHVSAQEVDERPNRREQTAA
jgi:hypothetical protein